MELGVGKSPPGGERAGLVSKEMEEARPKKSAVEMEVSSV